MTIRIFDKELELRNAAATAITSTTAGTGIAVDLNVGIDYKVAIVVSALDFAQETETYVISVEVDTVSNFATEVEVGSLAITSTGEYEIPLSSAWVQNLEPGASYIRVVATLDGDSPSLKYGAFLAPA